MCCLCECDLCETLEDEYLDCPLWASVDADLEDDWEAPEWINFL